MNNPLPTLYAQRDQLLELLRTLERKIGDKNKPHDFDTDHGPVEGKIAYSVWRTRIRDKIFHTTREYQAVRKEIAVHEQLTANVQILTAVWYALTPYPGLAALREKVRVHLRDEYEVFVKD